MYACDYDIVGIVQVNSRYQSGGHSAAKWIEAQIDQYAQVLPNLKKHNPDYPSAEFLKSVLKVGNENRADLNLAPPNMNTKDTPGSQLIIDTLLDNDPRPVHVPSWGGCNTTAYALWKLKTSYTKAQFDYAVSRIRIYAIQYVPQDGGGPWIIANIPEAYFYEAKWWSRSWNYDSIGDDSNNPPNVREYMSSSWLNANVKSGHGPLGAAYTQSYVSEGDTPSWLPLVNNGLEQHIDYKLGGWGGRPVIKSGNYMVDGKDDDPGAQYPEAKTFWRWIIAAQNDFAARMDWGMASSYSGANHQPVARVVGNLNRDVSPGQTVTLDASPTIDPDGNSLTYTWWQYYESDSAATKLTINNGNSKVASFIVPNEPGKQLHIILEVKDNGTPPLTYWQRVICHIK
jgi:hypothetical protein